MKERTANDIPPPVEMPARIELVRKRIDENLDIDEGLDVLARAADLSPFHFHRLFRGIVGETVVGYRRRRRLERAANRIVDGADDLLEVALEAGYASHEAFTRAFQRTFGLLPSGLRPGALLSPTSQGAMNRSLSLRIEHSDPLTVAYVRHVGPYADVGSAWETLMSWGWRKMIFGSPKTFGLSHDDPTTVAAEALRYDACIEVKPKTRVKGDIALKLLEGGAFAVALHEGPYESFSETYAELFAAIASEEIDGAHWTLGDPPSREVYLNDPKKTKPADLRAEIWMPVKRA